MQHGHMVAGGLRKIVEVCVPVVAASSTPISRDLSRRPAPGALGNVAVKRGLRGQSAEAPLSLSFLSALGCGASLHSSWRGLEIDRGNKTLSQIDMVACGHRQVDAHVVHAATPEVRRIHIACCGCLAVVAIIVVRAAGYYCERSASSSSRYRAA